MRCSQAYPTVGTPAYVYNWENSAPAVALLLAEATDFKERRYVADIRAFLSIWLKGGKSSVEYTPHLLAWTAGGVCPFSPAVLVHTSPHTHHCDAADCVLTRQLRP